MSKPVCDCIEKMDGYWIAECQCENSGDYAKAISWCADANRPPAVSVEALERLLQNREGEPDSLDYALLEGGIRDLIDEAKARED